MTLAVTGSTGVVGGMVARAIAAAGLPQRLLARNPARVPDLPGATTAACSYSDADAARLALEGVTTLFMVSASESADRVDQHSAFVGAAARAGVEHIVYTSFAAAALDATFTLARDHFATERAIEESGMRFTLLRDNLYLDFVSALAGDDDVIRGPAGDGTAAFVARADVARAASAVLQDPSAHRDVTYDLTGPEALSLTDVARIVTATTDRPVTFHDETVEEAYASRQKWGAPDWQVDAWVSTYTSIRSGELSTVSDDIRRVTGTPPRGLADYLTGT